MVTETYNQLQIPKQPTESDTQTVDGKSDDDHLACGAKPLLNRGRFTYPEAAKRQGTQLPHLRIALGASGAAAGARSRAFQRASGPCGRGCKERKQPS